MEALASADTQWTQRQLAQRTGYSIGLVNTVLKKLSRTGYIKIANLDSRRLRYLLTPQGLTATSRVACSYILRTFRDYQQLYLQISGFFQELSAQGYRDFCVSCDTPELKPLLHVVIRDCGMASHVMLNDCTDGGMTRVHLKGATVTGAGPVLDMKLIMPTDGGAP